MFNTILIPSHLYPAGNEKENAEISSLNQITKKFYEKLNQGYNHNNTNKHELRTEELNKAWEALNSFAYEIKKKFDLVDCIVLLGDGNRLKIEDSNKKKVVFSIPSKGVSEEGTFDFSPGYLDGIGDYAISLKNPEILDGLSENLPKENSILILCHDIAMLMLVRKLNEHNELYVSLADAIGNELVQINNVIALCTANLLKEKYLLTLRMFRHENAHISTRLMGNINRYFNAKGQRFINAPEEKRELICNDMKNTVQLISNIADNIGIVIGSGISQETAVRFDVVDMLYKWQIMFRDELENRNLDIIIYRGGYDSSTVGYKLMEYLNRFTQAITQQDKSYEEVPRQITIKPRLFELLVYNLVDNAVKYAYRGTNIYLIWNRLKEDYELSITSFGPYMEEGDSMYGLYVRGTDNPSRSVKGDGLGLYVVKQIAENLDIQVDHSIELISRYNVPLIPWYCKNDFSRMKNYKKIDDTELKRDQNESLISLAKNEHSFSEIKKEDLTSVYLSKRIQQETWRTTFSVRIPIN